jgi:hypothetical protein
VYSTTRNNHIYVHQVLQANQVNVEAKVEGEWVIMIVQKLDLNHVGDDMG